MLELGIVIAYGVMVHIGVKDHLTDQEGKYEQEEHYSAKAAITRFKSVSVRISWGATGQEQCKFLLK